MQEVDYNEAKKYTQIGMVQWNKWTKKSKMLSSQSDCTNYRITSPLFVWPKIDITALFAPEAPANPSKYQAIHGAASSHTYQT
jgi:hypothetical protein